MSMQNVPESINLSESARNCAIYTGDLSLVGSERLRGLAECGQVQVEIHCGYADNDVEQISVECHAVAHVVCQRCMQPMEFPIDRTSTFRLVTSEEATNVLPVDVEAIEIDEDGYISLRDLLEDEIILALPLVARHEPEACAQKIDRVAKEASRPNPFAALAALSTSKGE